MLEKKIKMKIKNGLKKGLTIFGISSILSFPLNYCKKTPDASLEQKVKPELPIVVYVDTESMSEESFYNYVGVLRELDAQAKTVGVNLIWDIERSNKLGPDYLFGSEYLLSEDWYIDYPGMISKGGRGFIKIDANIWSEKEKGIVLGRLFMKQIIGESDDSSDLTYKMPGHRPPETKLSEKELYRLAEKYGTVKIK
ncbi:hypothetical protein AYK26_00215 [Euryarchaeota archaeon SM23-78]|nr:MAG: hypothetical protein AYK26_00215 [Euryarchaeota archaeon SM23-78]MBW3001386.1 hypothetical protein [Candidatus Woesearchaeota archaeon]